tara:strand:- start:844 stop:1239 length:396 start_codon:yes stop_codon:yes gene_type:complete
MKTEEKYHMDWLSSFDEKLEAADKLDLDRFILSQPKIYAQWVSENLVTSSSSLAINCSSNFNAKVLDTLSVSSIQDLDNSYLLVSFIGISASFILLLNLFIVQNSWSIEALIGLAQMDAESANFLFDTYTK